METGGANGQSSSIGKNYMACSLVIPSGTFCNLLESQVANLFLFSRNSSTKAREREREISGPVSVQDSLALNMTKTPAQDSASPKKKLGFWGTLLAYFLAIVCPCTKRCTSLRNTSDVPMKVVTRRYCRPDSSSGFLEKELTFEIAPHQVVQVHHAAYKRSSDITVRAHVYPKIRTSPNGDEVFPTTPSYGEDLYPNGTPNAKIIRANFNSYDLMMKKEIRLAYEHGDDKVGFQSDDRELPRDIRFCFCGKLNEPMEETEARARGYID